MFIAHFFLKSASPNVTILGSKWTRMATFGNEKTEREIFQSPLLFSNSFDLFNCQGYGPGRHAFLQKGTNVAFGM